MKNRTYKIIIFFSFLFCGIVSQAEVKIHKLFSSNMVLQRDVNIPVYGTADEGEWVTVTLGEETRVTACSKGEWKVFFSPRKAGDLLKMKVKGESNNISLDNILIGDVWLCGGQSNMAFALKNCSTNEDILSVNNSNLRLFKVIVRKSDSPLSTLSEEQSGWSNLSSKSVESFSAVAYYFGDKIQKDAGVPVGLLGSYRGGTAIEIWTPAEVLNRQGKLTEENTSRSGGVTNSDLYNGMIEPLIDFPVKGVIWYQGEANSKKYETCELYRHLFPDMITSWRAKWGLGDLPFLFVQLASFKTPDKEPKDDKWPRLREAQTAALCTPGTGMAVATDVGEKGIHPKNKKRVGERLALAALSVAYNKDVVYSGPVFNRLDIEGSKAIITFDHLGGGLVQKGYMHDTFAVSGKKLQGFAICGSDSTFVWADARIEGDRVVVSSSKVKRPVAVRYAWSTFPMANLYNKEGLPAVSFRTDRFPAPVTEK